MQVVVLTNDELKEELQGLNEPSNVECVNNPAKFHQFRDADAYIDLLFDYNTERIQLLKKLPPKPVLINAVT